MFLTDLPLEGSMFQGVGAASETPCLVVPSSA